MFKHAASMTVVLFALWLLLSGHFDNAVLLGFGLVSTAFAVFLALRMEVVDHESYPFHMTRRLVRFWLFLGKEMVVTNIDVARRILGPRNRISPRVITIRPPQRSDLGLAIYANSITLTPGTVSMEVLRKGMTVHALTKESADDLIAGRMARRVPEVPFAVTREDRK
jgi:multicomponent Na+:H+ antiporter subunit E